MQKFELLASLCSWAGWFEHGLVYNVKTGFLALVKNTDFFTALDEIYLVFTSNK